MRLLKRGLLQIDWEHEYKTVKDNRELRMRNVKETDSGRFKCTAVNGFGYQSVEFIIQVYDPETDVLTIRDRISIANQCKKPRRRRWNIYMYVLNLKLLKRSGCSSET